MPGLIDRVKRLSRREALAVGGLAAAGALTVGVGLGGRRESPTEAILKHIDPANAVDLGDGFFIAGGWVLTIDDLKRLETHER